MDRVRAWMENRSSSVVSEEEDAGANSGGYTTPYDGRSSSVSFTTASGYGPESGEHSSSTSSWSALPFRPPPLRTARTYDDDDAFNAVAANLLSRHRIHDNDNSAATIEAIIRLALPRRQERASFLEGIQHRRLSARFAHLPATTKSLVADVDKAFGVQLRKIVDAETASVKRQQQHQQPGGNAIMMMGSSSGSRNHHHNNHQQHHSGAHQGSSGGQQHHHHHHHSHHNNTSSHKQQSKKSRRFFPDHHSHGDSSTVGSTSSSSSVSSSSSFFLRSRKVQNIDFKLVEAISQVQSLRLDGAVTPTTTAQHHQQSQRPSPHEYEPPSMSY